MPATMPQRQIEPPAALDWFASPAGQGLLLAEAAAMERVLQRCPALPWAWFGVAGAEPPTVTGRGILLSRRHRDWSGSIRCRLPLPLPSE